MPNPELSYMSIDEDPPLERIHAKQTCGADDASAARTDKLAAIDAALCEISNNATWLEQRMDALEQRRVEECM